MSDSLYSEKILSHYYHPLNQEIVGEVDAERLAEGVERAVELLRYIK